MQKASTAYQFEMKKNIRSRQYVRIKFGLIDIDAGGNANFSDGDQLYYSSFSNIVNDKYSVTKSYATFEPNRIKLDGKQILAGRTNNIYQGYVSSVMSDSLGVYTVAPVIKISFTKTHRTQGMSFVFDNATKEYIKKMRIRTTNSGKQVDDVIAEFKGSYGVYNNLFEDFDYMELTILESSEPFRRARLQTVIFGIGYIFTNNEIISLEKSVDIDPINRRLPYNSAKFIIQDLDLMYDLDNPTGIWEAMEMNLPVSLEFGQYINNGLTWEDVYSETWGELELTTWGTVYEGGYTEWIPLGDYNLSGKPATDKYNVTFNCQDLISMLTMDYMVGMYTPNGKTLYSLVSDIISYCNIPDRADGKPNYYVHDSLKNISTSAPIPIKPVREILQMIAHASNCVLYTDSLNIIRIEPINSIQDNFYLGFYDQMDIPKGEKIPILSMVTTNVYNYFIDTKVDTLSEQTIIIDQGIYSSFIRFEPATNIDVTVSTGKVVYTKYSSSVYVTITGTGECVIKITGNRILNSISPVNVSTGQENGETDNEDNPLITSIEVAKSQALHIKDYLQYRTTYNLENIMGYPEVESTDMIYIQSQFTDKFPARVLKHDFTFNGAAKSKMIVKRMVK